MPPFSFCPRFSIIAFTTFPKYVLNMIQELRQAFNQSFTEEKYRQFLQEIHPSYNLAQDFRIAETPVFVGRELKQEIFKLFDDVKAFLETPGFAEKMAPALPKNCRVPNEDHSPAFVAIDFAICKGEEGKLIPQLIEMQGIASLFCYQHHLCQAYLNQYEEIPTDSFDFFLQGDSHESYVEKLKKLVIADAPVEEVIIMDIEPHQQKTRIDFIYTEQDLGIQAVCLTEVIKEGRKLFYINKKTGKKTPIRRIYNRAIFDELHLRKDLNPSFDMTEEVDVERWVAHPNWFFKVSKYCLPFMDSPYVPQSHFLHELSEYPSDLEHYVLKPLFSFAGAGVKLDVTEELLQSIEEPSHYLLQKKVEYTPCIQTLDVPAKVEIRLLCTWDKELQPLLSLARLSKGRMIGVDYNKEKTWVGSSAVFFER